MCPVGYCSDTWLLYWKAGWVGVNIGSCKKNYNLRETFVYVLFLHTLVTGDKEAGLSLYFIGVLFYLFTTIITMSFSTEFDCLCITL